MAARFLAATKADFAQGDCVEIYQTHTSNGKRTVYSIEVSYPGELAFDPASSVYGVGDLSWDMTGKFSGLYLDYDSCVADLVLRTAEYRQHTGLMPVAAFCERSSMTTDYVMQVDGFGEPRKTLYVFAPDRIAVATDAAVVSDVKAMISRMGAQLVAEQGARLFYYSEESIHLRGASAADFDNLKYCQEQLGEAQKIFTNHDSAPASVHCVATTDILIPFAVELAVIYSGVDSPTSFDGREIYASFEECRLDHDGALAREAREHPFVVGGLCRPSEDGHYVLAVYQIAPNRKATLRAAGFGGWSKGLPTCSQSGNRRPNFFDLDAAHASLPETSMKQSLLARFIRHCQRPRVTLVQLRHLKG